MRTFIICLCCALLFTHCGSPATPPDAATILSSGSDFVPSIELSVDGKKHTNTADDILSANYLSQQSFGLAVMSEKQDFQFSIVAFMAELKPGVYLVYDCKGPSNCDAAMDDKNQIALYAPYPKDPMPAVSTSRIAYNAPALTLEPLTLNITSVTDEQQAGTPTKTKRVKGAFNGTLAYVEQKPGGMEWQVVGKTTQVKGTFDVYCVVK